MTVPALYRPALTLEQERDQQVQKYSRTSAEREQIAADLHGILTRYGLQGGRDPIKWLKAGGFSHGSAVNLSNAGYALQRGAAPGQGVSKLATVGRWLKKNKTLVEAQDIADDQQARQEATAAAGIGVGKVSYPTDAAQEVATIYADLATACQEAGVPIPPDTAEMTLMLARIAKSNLTPQSVQQIGLGGVRPSSNRQASIKQPDFYSWLAAQPCAVCSVPGVQLHHVQLPDLPGQAGGRRFHDSKHKELLLPLCPRHHSHARDAAHQMKQSEWSWQHFGEVDGAIIAAARYLSEWAQEVGALKGVQP